jgi:streptogramin lyase/mono/diheme cytochrome c family protein
MSLRTVNRNLAAGIATGVLMFVAPSVWAADGGNVQGVIGDASGKPVAGAFVKLKNDEKRLTFMVISRDQGRFEAKDLPPGRYRVQGVAGDNQTEWFPNVIVAAGGEDAKVGLRLTLRRGPSLASAWPQRVPEAQVDKTPTDESGLPPGAGRQIVAERCISCHDLQRVLVKRSDRDDWDHTVARMRTRMSVASIPDLSPTETTAVVNYLAEKFPLVQPYDANSRLPRTVLSGKAIQYRAVQYDLVNNHAEPHDVAVDPKGNPWVAERAGKLGRLDAKTLEFTEISTPPGPAAPDRQSLGNPQIDSKGMLWVPDGPNARWLSYDTNSAKFVSYAWPRGKGNAGGNSMAIHPDGTIWATGGAGEARQLNPATGEFKFFPAPATKTQKNPGAYGLTVAGDGSVWYAEDEADLMARVDPVSGKVDEYKIPYEGHAYPRRMGADANGDLWVGLWKAGKLMKVDHKTRQMTIYSPPTSVIGSYSVVVDKKNNYVWMSGQQADMIVRFDPKTQEWVEFPLPEAETDGRRIDIDPTNPNRIYFAGNIPGRMGYIEVLPQ